MRTETTDLVALFTKNNGGKHNWRYKGVDTSLPAEEIKEACELLTTLDLFEQDGVKLFDSVVTAKFVSTKVTTLFDLKNEIDVDQLNRFMKRPVKRLAVLKYQKNRRNPNTCRSRFLWRLCHLVKHNYR